MNHKNTTLAIAAIVAAVALTAVALEEQEQQERSFRWKRWCDCVGGPQAFEAVGSEIGAVLVSKSVPIELQDQTVHK